MNRTHKLLSVFVLTALLALAFSTPVYAFDGRGGDRVVIASNEVINDDLYVGAQDFVLDGTVKGDVIAVGGTVTINGKVDGDLIAAAQTVAVYGEVTGSLRMAGSALLVAKTAIIRGDLIGAGYSLEVQPGPVIGRDLVFAGQQLMLAGDVTRNVKAATGAFELRSKVGGNVTAEVGEASQAVPFSPAMFMPQTTIAIPSVKPGLTIAPDASVAGNLNYTQTQDLAIPAGVVLGRVLRTLPTTTQTVVHEPTAAELVGKWAADFVRNIVSLLLIGFLLLWLFPTFMNGLSESLRSKPLPSLGWGLVIWMGFFFALLVVIAVTILVALLFGALTLSQLTGTTVWLGLLALFGLIMAFVLTTAFVAKVIFGITLGKWLFVQFHSPLAEHRYWPMVVGVLVTLAVTALLSFPLVPGLLGWLVDSAVILLGLGTFWRWGVEHTVRKPSMPKLAPAPI